MGGREGTNCSLTVSRRNFIFLIDVQFKAWEILVMKADVSRFRLRKKFWESHHLNDVDVAGHAIKQLKTKATRHVSGRTSGLKFKVVVASCMATCLPFKVAMNFKKASILLFFSWQVPWHIVRFHGKFCSNIFVFFQNHGNVATFIASRTCYLLWCNHCNVASLPWQVWLATAVCYWSYSTMASLLASF